MERAARDRLGDALTFALAAHADQQRRGSEAPYGSHLLQVAGLVLEHGGDAEQVAAGLLHDALEDCDAVTPAELEKRFGAGVARIVADCTDTLEGDRAGRKSEWRLRKQRYLERLARADARSVLVAACDKRHNLACMVSDLRLDGPSVFERFRAGADDQLWYFDGFLQAAGDRLPPRLRREIEQLLLDLRALLGK